MNNMRTPYALKWLFVTLIALVSTNKALSQTGNIQGIISDENGIAVPGANVLIPALAKGTISDFDGRFTLIGIIEGNHMLTVSYLGFADIEQEVAITTGKTGFISLNLIPQSLELTGVEVTGYGFSSQAKALNTQKNNMNITNVVSTEQIGKFPDANIGDAVKRIPGITMQVDQGEARNIIVRGLSPQLNSVTLNGSRIPSAEGDNRNVQMDLIPADMIQSIEVSKAVTPDKDADALGGAVNLITRTSPQGFRLSATAGSGINFITDQRILNGSFILGDRSKDGKFGWMVSASINDTDFGSDNVEAEWSDEFAFFNGVEEEGIEVAPFTNVNEVRTYFIQRVRRSFSANSDFQLNNNSKFYFKSMYNWRDDRENRFRLTQEILDPEDIEQGDFTITNGIPTRFPVEVSRKTKGGIDGGRIDNRRLEDQRMQNYTLGGDHLLGSLKLNWMGSYARASEERLNERFANFTTELIINNDNSNPRFPVFSPTDLANENNLANFEFEELTEENQFTEEEDINFFVDFKLPANFFGDTDGSLKFGARGRFKNKLRDNDFFEFDVEDMFPNLGAIPTKNYTDPNFLAGSKFRAGSFASELWLGGLDLSSGGESVPDEFLRDNFEVSEDVWAGYIMANQKLTDKLGVLFGIRLENTSTKAIGNQIEDEENVVGQVTEENSYTNVLPGVHFKYDLTDRTILRLAWTNTLARPNYVDITPTIDILLTDGGIFQGNPDLDPTTSMNFDFMAEHYYDNVGIISGGLFYKNIKDFVYTFISVTNDDSLGPGTAGFELTRPLNGDDANIFGAEFSFQRQLDFLPGFARNFSIYANYTYITSSAEGIRNEDGELRDDLDLPNTAPNMFNGSLGYADKKLSARLSANFSDAYLDVIGGRPFEDRFYDQQFLLDFNASFALSKNFALYADLTNITNQPLRFYQGIRSRTQQVEFYGRRLTFGLKYDLFNKR